MSPKKDIKRKLNLLHILGVILFVVPGIAAVMVWTAHGIEDGSHILFETPVVIPLLISFSLSGLILIFVLIKSLLAAYRSEGG